MLRAADVTVKNGFRYFGIFTIRERASITSMRKPGSISTNDYVIGNTFYGPATFIPAETLNIAHSESRLTIKCFSNKPGNILVLDARLLQRSIRKAYNLSPVTSEKQSPPRRHCSDRREENQYKACHALDIA